MAARGRRGRKGDDEYSRISQLPKDMLQHILSFLPQKEAIQTCVLSKSWRHLGPTRPNVDLRESSGFNRDKVLFALEKTLQTYQDHTLSIQDLHVEMSAFDSKSSSVLGKLVKNKKVTTLRLALTDNTLRHFPLPRLIFRAESLNEMYLTRIKLHPIDKVHFKHLRTLHLERCYIEDEIFVNIISSCPLIEYLVLRSCQQLNAIKLNKAHNLTRFDFTPNSNELGTIFLNNPFTRLKSLHLRSMKLSERFFDKLSSENCFPCLEELELDSCRVFEEFWLSSCSIKRLIISEMPCKGLIDAANILYFRVSNSRVLPPSISLTTASKEWKTHVADCLEFCNRKNVSTCLLKTNELLKALSQSRISFRPSYPDSIKITDEHFVGVEPAVVEHLDLSRCQHCSFRSYPDMLICFFRICRPRYMVGMCSSVTVETQLRGSGELTSRKSKIVVKERVGLGKQRCFWQQDLEEIRSEVWDHNAKEWRHVQLGTISSSTLRALSNKSEFRYRLTWRGEGMRLSLK